MAKKKLNIAQLHWGFPPIVGGVETHLTIILPQMVKMGHNVSLLTGSVEGVKGRYKYEGVDIYRTPLMDLNWLSQRGLKGLEDEVQEAFGKFINKVKPDVIHTHNMHYFSEVHTKTLERLAKQNSIPLLVTAHNTWDDLLFMDLTHKIDWDHIIAVSHFIKKEIIGIGVDHRKVTVVHHGIDQKKYRPGIKTKNILERFPQLEGKKIVFHPARIGLAKGCDTSIKAMNLVKQKYPDIMLVLAGAKNIIDWANTQQKDIAYMVTLIKHFGMEENVLIDIYTLDEIRELYELSSVCLYPSNASEPFGLTMLEAMAMAKAMIVTNMGGMPEIIRDGINGFVIQVRDFEALTAKICQLLEDTKLCERFGYTGRQIIESHYTKEMVTNETIGVYRKFV